MSAREPRIHFGGGAMRETACGWRMWPTRVTGEADLADCTRIEISLDDRRVTCRRCLAALARGNKQ